MDCSLPGSSVYGILQTKILEWVALLCPGDHPNPGDELLHLPTLAGLKTQHSENQDHGMWSHHFMANRWGNNGNSLRLCFWALKSLQMVTAPMKLKDSLEEKL